MAERKKTTESLIALVAMEYEPEAAEAMAFVSELEQKEKEDFLTFLEGVRFGKQLAQKIAEALEHKKGVRTCFCAI